MKVGRSIVALVNKRSPPSPSSVRSRAVDPQLAQLSESIESMTQALNKGDAKVDDIVSYQADRVFKSSDAKTEAATPPAAVVAVAAGAVQKSPSVDLPAPVTSDKPKGRSSMLKKLLSRKTPSPSP